MSSTLNRTMLFSALWLVLHSWNAVTAEECPKAPSLIQRARSLRRKNEPCKDLSLEDCASGIVPGASPGLCRWDVDMHKCIAHIAWFHPMKAGSTFGATLAHFANGSLPATARMPSCGYIDDSFDDACPGGDQGPGEFFVHKYPIETWFQNVFWVREPADYDPGNHRVIRDTDFEPFKHSFVGIFRLPEERMVSAFNHFAEGKGDILKFRQYTLGTVTKMLAGSSPIGTPVVDCSFKYQELFADATDCSDEKCNECLRTPETDLPKALERLKSFAFVGLTEQFSLSVCLWHVMFGGECLPVEFENMRKGVEHTNTAMLLDELKDHQDPFDNIVYNKASDMFWSNIAAYDVDAAKCSALCPGAEFEMPADEAPES